MKQRASRPICARPTPSRDKQARHEKVDAVRARAQGAVRRRGRRAAALIAELFEALEADVVRGQILDTGRRIDGRDLKTVRPIEAMVGMLPRVHGSALFTRGETQALCVATLGTGQDEQMIDALEGDSARALHAALQLPALLGGRGRPHGLAGPPRGRPRQARLAGDPAVAADQGGLPLHDPRRLRGHGEQRLARRWPRSAAPRWR